MHLILQQSAATTFAGLVVLGDDGFARFHDLCLEGMLFTKCDSCGVHRGQDTQLDSLFMNGAR